MSARPFAYLGWMTAFLISGCQKQPLETPVNDAGKTGIQSYAQPLFDGVLAGVLDHEKLSPHTACFAVGIDLPSIFSEKNEQYRALIEAGLAEKTSVELFRIDIVEADKSENTSDKEAALELLISNANDALKLGAPLDKVEALLLSHLDQEFGTNGITLPTWIKHAKMDIIRLSPKAIKMMKSLGKEGDKKNLCFSRKTEVVELTNFTMPVADDGSIITTVQYKYRFLKDGIPDWALTTEMNSAFPQLEGLVSEEHNSQLTLIQTARGWRDHNRVWATETQLP